MDKPIHTALAPRRGWRIATAFCGMACNDKQGFVSTFRFSVRKSYIEGWWVGLDKSYMPLLASTVLDMLDAYTPGRSPVHTT